MFGISFEHILIVGVILIVLGPKRLPEIGNSMGKAIRNFKDSISGLSDEPNIKSAEQAPPPPAQLESNAQVPLAEPIASAANVSLKKTDSGDTPPQNG
jgi:sec-independent protein translocase protein TatA